MTLSKIIGSHRCRWPFGNSSWPASAGGRRITRPRPRQGQLPREMSIGPGN